MKKAGIKKGFLIAYGIIGLAVVVAAVAVSTYNNRITADAVKVCGPSSGCTPEAYSSCLYSGGTWQDGGNDACAGLCLSGATECAQVITPYCDCGAGKCLDPTTRKCTGSGSVYPTPSATSSLTPTPSATRTVPARCANIKRCLIPELKEVCDFTLMDQRKATCPTCTCATSTITPTSTPSSSSTSTAVGNKITEIILKAKAFTAFNIPVASSAGLKVCNASKQSSASIIYNYPKFGLYEWALGNASDGTVILPKIGYYGLNQWDTDVKIELCTRSSTPADGETTVIYPNEAGSWFLLSYGYKPTSGLTVKYADLDIYIAKKGYKTCNSTTCAEKKKLGDLVAEDRIYNQAYEISDPNGTDPNTTFTLRDLSSGNSGSMTLTDGGKDYWVYVWPE